MLQFALVTNFLHCHGSNLTLLTSVAGELSVESNKRSTAHNGDGDIKIVISAPCFRVVYSDKQHQGEKTLMGTNRGNTSAQYPPVSCDVR
jgi:hypothetical protein